MRSVSVIIPIYNAEIYLNDLFECLDICPFDKEDEIILIDNGSTDLSASICLGKTRSDKKYKYYEFIDKADSYAARNYGVTKANGDILAFIDSDCKPTAKWLIIIKEKLIERTVLAGNIKLEFNKANVWECFDNVAHLNQCKINAKKNCVATANMAVYKKDFYYVGKFIERFSGGDFEWSQRAAKKRLNIIFFSEAIVYHPTRKTFYDTLKKEERIAYGRGKQYKIDNKSLAMLLIVYFLRIFKISTQLKFSFKLRKYNISYINLVYFNFCFFVIRFAYIKYVIKGFKSSNVRELGLK